MPQAPKWVLSVARSRQLPEQWVCVFEQVVVHTPPEQICPRAQARPETMRQGAEERVRHRGAAGARGVWREG